MKADLTKTADVTNMRPLTVDFEAEGLEGAAPHGAEWQDVEVGLLNEASTRAVPEGVWPSRRA